MVELLVVCAVVALLAGLLFVGGSAALRSSKSTTCKSNLRSIGMGLQMYSQDHGGRYPPYPFREWQGVRPDTDAIKASLETYGVPDALWWCPLDGRRGSDFDGMLGTHEFASYGYEMPVYYAAVEGPRGEFVFGDRPEADPSTFIQMVDLRWLVEEGEEYWWQTGHGDHYNALFLDGHVKTRRHGVHKRE